MIGLVLIGHSRIASEMLHALQHVVGEESLIASVDVTDECSPEIISDILMAKIQACDVGEGVLLLADMFGGTPCNVAMGCLQAGHVELISGFNLPLLIKAATLRHHEKNLSSLAQKVMQSGRQYIQMAPTVVLSPPVENADE